MTNKNDFDDVGASQDLVSALHERADAFAHFRHTVIPKRNHFRFLAAAALIGIVGLIALPKEDADGAEPDAEFVMGPALDISRFDMGLESDFVVPSTVKTVTLKPGDNLGPLLQRNGLSGPEAYRLTQAFGEVYKPRNLRAGQDFNLHFVDNTLDHLTFKPNVETTVFIDRNGEDFTARKIDAEFKYETIGVKATIENSLYVDATRLGAPDKVVVQFANIYEYSVDFQRDIQPGDAFEMFFEVARDQKGEIVKAGDLLYTSFSPRGKTSEYWLFEDKKGRENHLQKFARGVKTGAYVKQDQVIGYVGTTGRSTGPHLHYEVIHHGKKINPRRLSQLSGKPLSKDQHPAFKAQRQKIETMRARSETLTPALQAGVAVSATALAE